MLAKVLKFVFDGRIFWFLRGLIYKIFIGKSGLFYLGKPIYVYGFSRINIGNMVGIFPGSRLEVLRGGSFKIGDNVSIGQGLHVVVSGDLSIGKCTIISGNVLITDLENTLDQFHLRYSERDEVVKEVHIGNNCFIGYGAVILPGTILEDGCIVGANSVVKGHYKKYSIVGGVPSKLLRVVKHE